MSSRGSGDRRERELDGHELRGVFAVAVLDGVDDRLAHGDANPVDRVLVEAGELRHAVADHLDEVQHVEVTVDLQLDRAAACQHAGRRHRADGRDAAETMGAAGCAGTRHSNRIVPVRDCPDSLTGFRLANREPELAMRSNVIVRTMRHGPPTRRPVRPAARRPGRSRVPATSRSRTVTRCWRRWPTAYPRFRAISTGADCLATLACLRGARRRDRHGRPTASSKSRAGASRPHGRQPRRSTRRTPGRRCGCWRASLAAHRFRTCSAATRRCRAARCGASSRR